MCEKGNTRLLWGSVLTGVAYLIWVSCYIADNRGVVWPGVSALVLIPHILCTLTAVIRTVTGIIVRQNRVVLQGVVLYGAAAALFPPFHVFLIVPVLLMGAWCLKKDGGIKSQEADTFTSRNYIGTKGRSL